MHRQLDAALLASLGVMREGELCRPTDSRLTAALQSDPSIFFNQQPFQGGSKSCALFGRPRRWCGVTPFDLEYAIRRLGPMQLPGYGDCTVGSR